ncbi:hypothetical protein C8J56DRAFT_1028057 [Mycena floridula]|nr:hypothetical protein C8J56DRAFT_1028057 [Mycena floridula]
MDILQLRVRGNWRLDGFKKKTKPEFNAEKSFLCSARRQPKVEPQKLHQRYDVSINNRDTAESSRPAPEPASTATPPEPTSTQTPMRALSREHCKHWASLDNGIDAGLAYEGLGEEEEDAVGAEDSPDPEIKEVLNSIGYPDDRRMPKWLEEEFTKYVKQSKSRKVYPSCRVFPKVREEYPSLAPAPLPRKLGGSPEPRESRTGTLKTRSRFQRIWRLSKDRPFRWQQFQKVTAARGSSEMNRTNQTSSDSGANQIKTKQFPFLEHVTNITKHSDKPSSIVFHPQVLARMLHEQILLETPQYPAVDIRMGVVAQEVGSETSTMESENRGQGSSVGSGDGLGVVNVQGVDSVAVEADAVVLSATIPAASVSMPEQEIHSSTRSSGRNAKRRTSDAGGQGGSEALKKIKIAPLMKAR